jgi:DNA-binding transcriptional LysR family regulator
LKQFGAEVLNLLWRREIHLGVSLLRSVQTDGRDFATQPLQPVELVAACQPTFPLKKGKRGRVQDVVGHLLLLFASAFSVRMTFDAACRMSQLTPDVMLESNAPSNLLALAEGGHGIAVITSLVQTHRYRLRMAQITHVGPTEGGCVVYRSGRARGSNIRKCRPAALAAGLYGNVIGWEAKS